MTPEEDKYLCKHEWVDLIGGAGMDKSDPYTALATFYCNKCLQIRIKSHNQSRFSISKEILKEFNEDNAEGVV